MNSKRSDIIGLLNKSKKDLLELVQALSDVDENDPNASENEISIDGADGEQIQLNYSEFKKAGVVSIASKDLKVTIRLVI